VDVKSISKALTAEEPGLQAARAIAMLNNSELGGRRIHVREDRVDDDRDVRQARPERGPSAASMRLGSSRGGGGRGRCYVGNLAWQTGWQDLKDKFREAGRVVHADVLLDESGGGRKEAAAVQLGRVVQWRRPCCGTNSCRSCTAAAFADHKPLY
jgi:hypothetical protein